MFKHLKSGLALTIILSLVLILVFYYKLIFSINSVYFVDSGDGIQSYFGVYYHAKFGTSLLHFNGMNYPFGESIFFSVNPPLLGILLYIVNQVYDISNYTIGIFNTSILFSLLISAIFIYLILCRFNIIDWQRAILAVLITFISPQIIRIGGHYALAYMFVIPGIFWYIIKYHENPNTRIVVLASLFTLMISMLHLYFFAFAALLWIIYHFCIFIYVKDYNLKNIANRITHLFFQVFFPYILLLIFININNDITDRTSVPWGLLNFKTNFTGVFYPFDKIYTPIINLFINPMHVEWEGKMFFGIFTALGMLFIISKLAYYFISLNFKKLFNPFDNIIINLFAWFSIISFIIACAYPLNTNFGTLLFDNFNFFKQFRGIARFAWISYYAASIVTVYALFSLKKKNWIIIFSFLILTLDAFLPNLLMQNQYNNKIVEIEDVRNDTEKNKWLNGISFSEYQTIITFPFYTNGSENIYDQKGSWAIRYGMIVSMKTGIPIYSIHMSRTSISQAYKNYNLIQEPYRYPEILNLMKKNKKLLIIVIENEINEQERAFLNLCKKLNSNNEYSIYEIDYSTLCNKYSNLYKNLKKTIASNKLDYIDVSKANNIVYNNFENFNSSNAYFSKRASSHPIQHYHTFFNDTLPNVQVGKYIVSFWVGNFNRDLLPRTTYNITLTDSYGRIYENRESILGTEFKIIDNKWALIESEIILNSVNDKVKITVWNKELKSDSTYIDNLLIRPKGINVYSLMNDFLMLNNRYYLKGKI